MRAALLLAVLVTGALAQLPYARQALDLGRTRDEALFTAFNRGYEMTPGELIDRAEIVTEFRRAVLIVREHANRADLTFSEHELSKEMEPVATAISFIVQARLHPLNTYSNAPAYGLYIETGPRSKPLAPKPFTREPVYAPGTAGPGRTILAVRLEGRFEREDITAAAAPALVITDEQANVIWKTRIDLTRYR
jgi:hypothetical protein